MIVVFTGIREIDPRMTDEVELAVLEEIGTGATELRFGGALGSDTLALLAVCSVKDARKVGYVPFTVYDQPQEAREVLQSCADEVVELRLPKSKRAYLDRNLMMLEGADRLVAFTDGRTEGGTAYTIRNAEKLGLPVAIVPVSALATNPQLQGEFSGPIYSLSNYVSAQHGSDVLSEAVRANKRGRATTTQIRKLVKDLVQLIDRTPELSGAAAIVAMPRRTPGEDSDMRAIAEGVARTRSLQIYDLERIEEPLGGKVKARRLRFPADEHARTLQYGSDRAGDRVIILDNVLTTGASMEGAMRVVAASGDHPVGLTVLYSASFVKAA